LVTATLDWLAIAGPTASGKTALALALAAKRPIEIISVDSALVYKGMDIGTAKPTPSELAQVPHHLIDIIDPADSYSAAAFVRDATACLHAIRARGRLPVLVGGTMLYFKALFEGLDDIPAADPLVRVQIEAQAAEKGWPALHAKLQQIDPATAERLSPNDSQRIGRALEVYEATGQTLSSFHTRQSAADAHPDRSTLSIDGLKGQLWSLEPTDRAWLHQRIAQRFDAMLAQGFLNEVQHLRARGDLHPGLPSMRCVGYRQAWAQLNAANNASPSEWTVAQHQTLRDTGIAATRQLAKRQLTWLRSMPRRTVVACDAPNALPAAIKQIEEALGPA
jgi:tRNA dimethylallyltransferase